VVVAKEFAATAHADVRTVHDVRNDEMILDIGPDTADRFSELVAVCRHHHLERPAGGVRISSSSAKARAPFPRQSRAARHFRSPGGGDTLAAIEKYNIEDGFSYISTGGGAFLEFGRGQDAAGGGGAGGNGRRF